MGYDTPDREGKRLVFPVVKLNINLFALNVHVSSYLPFHSVWHWKSQLTLGLTMRRREYKRKRDGLGRRGIFQELRVTLLKKFLLLGGWVGKNNLWGFLHRRHWYDWQWENEGKSPPPVCRNFSGLKTRFWLLLGSLAPVSPTPITFPPVQIVLISDVHNMSLWKDMNLKICS